MKRSIGVLILLAFAVGCPGDDTGGGGGKGELTCDDGSATHRECPGLGSTGRATAIETLQKWEASANAKFENVKWLGGISGLYIGRDGRVLAEDFTVSTTEFMGQVLEIPSVTSWQCNYCIGGGPVPHDKLHFTTVAGGACGAVLGCDELNCDAAPEYALPTIDSDQAILLAFPDDPDNTIYGVQLVYAIDDDWTVSRMDVRGQVPAAAKVDSRTGEVTTNQ